jgi:hypothetical protein
VYKEIDPEDVNDYPNNVYPILVYIKTSSGLKTRYTGVKHV